MSVLMPVECIMGSESESLMASAMCSFSPSHDMVSAVASAITPSSRRLLKESFRWCISPGYCILNFMNQFSLKVKPTLTMK